MLVLRACAAEFPEPRILEIVPDTIVTVLRLCSRILDAVTDAVYPLTPEQSEMLMQVEVSAIPREFARVIQRQEEGKIKNEEQLSSELEDASFDYYRRLLRSGTVGATDEAEDEFMSKQLFGEQLQPSVAVAEAYAAEHPEVLLPPEVRVAAMLPEDVDPETAWQTSTAVVQALQGATEEQRAAAAIAAQAKDMARLRQAARSGWAHARGTTVRAGLGVGISLLAAKGLGWGVARAIKMIRKARRKAAGGRASAPAPGRQARGSSPQLSAAPTPRPTDPGSAAAAAQAAASARSAARQPAATPRQQPPSASPSSAAASSAEKKEQPASSTGTTPTRRTRAATRTR